MPSTPRKSLEEAVRVVTPLMKEQPQLVEAIAAIVYHARRGMSFSWNLWKEQLTADIDDRERFLADFEKLIRGDDEVEPPNGYDPVQAFCYTYEYFASVFE